MIGSEQRYLRWPDGRSVGLRWGLREDWGITVTMMHMEDLECPECGHEQAVPVWGSVNVGIDPELRTKLYEGEINSFRCEGCGFEALLGMPLLYHDPIHGFAVQYYPAEFILDDDFYETFESSYPVALAGMRREAPQENSLPWEYMFHPHVVFDMGELVKCVAFFERLLPDRFQDLGQE